MVVHAEKLLRQSCESVLEKFHLFQQKYQSPKKLLAIMGLIDTWEKIVCRQAWEYIDQLGKSLK